MTSPFILFSFSLKPLRPIELFASSSPPLVEEELVKGTEQLLKESTENAKFYSLPQGVDYLDITDDLLRSSTVSEERKETIRSTERRIIVFKYPSDGLAIKGIFSFLPTVSNHPLLVFLRGGNRIFGTPHPANDFLCAENCNVIATTYRDGVSEGKDEFGGNDVNDVKHLMDFLPQLESWFNVSLQKEKKYIIGASRGGMQLFLTLARFPELQSQFEKIVSLSGVLDMRTFANRPDVKKIFIDHFDLIENQNEEEWYNWRDPLLTVPQLNSKLPILILQGNGDNRIKLEEGYRMTSLLQKQGNDVTYWEIENGNHCLTNVTGSAQFILDWLNDGVS